MHYKLIHGLAYIREGGLKMSEHTNKDRMFRFALHHKKYIFGKGMMLKL